MLSGVKIRQDLAYLITHQLVGLTIETQRNSATVLK
jgi:hypothetical protein